MRVVLPLVLLAASVTAQDADPNRIFQQAVRAQQRGDFAAAVRDYRRLLKLHPDSAEVRINLGAALVQLRQFDEAIAQYQTVLKADSGNDAVRLNLALAFYKEQHFAEAREQLEIARKTKADDLRIAILLADCYGQLKQPEKAVELLLPFESQALDNLDLAYVLGSALIQTGHRREGVARIEKVAQTGNSADACLLAGSTFLDLDEIEKARHYLEQALALNPKLPGIDRLTGVAREKDGDPAGAETLLRKALSLDPNDFTANLYLGAILYKDRKLDECRVYLERALRLDPSSSLARYEMALLESSTGSPETAVQDLEKLTAADPKWLEPHVRLAALYFRLHRSADGARERKIVEQLTAEQQRQGPR